MTSIPTSPETTQPPGEEGVSKSRPSRRSGLVKLLLAVVAATLAVLLVIPRTPVSSNVSVQFSKAALGAAAVPRLGMSASECDQPSIVPPSTWTSGSQAASARLTSASAPRVGGDEPFGFNDIYDSVMSNLWSGAVNYGEDAYFGWIMGAIFGGKSDSIDPAQVQQDFQQVSSQLNNLSQAQYDDCTAIIDTLQAMQSDTDSGLYSNLAGQMADQLGALQTYQDDFNSILSTLQANGGNGSALSSDEKADLEDMINGSQDGLLGIINTINDKEVGGQPGADGMVSFYDKVLVDKYNYDPFRTHLFPAAFVDEAAAQQQYYSNLMAEAAYLYANVEHLSWTDGTYSHSPNSEAVTSFLGIVQQDVQSWTSAFADGPVGDGTPNWVSQLHGFGIGAIPANTVLDYRNQNDPMLWTTTPANLTGEPTGQTPYYCGTTVQYCFDHTFAKVMFRPGDVQIWAPVDTKLVPASPEPIATMVSDAGYDGLSGWRVPTTADINTLQAGATGGLGTWGPANSLDMFAPATFTSHYGGVDKQMTEILPILVNSGSAASPTYTVGIAQPTDDTLTYPDLQLADGTENDLAGQVFLVQDFQPTTPPPSNGPAAGLASGARPAHGVPAPTAPKVGASTVGVARVNYSTPSACTANVYTVPAGVGFVQITAVGGHGTAGYLDGNAVSAGGAGGLVGEILPVTAGDKLYVQVGGSAGASGKNYLGGLGGGGDGGFTQSLEHGDTSGGGGGMSFVSSSPQCQTSQSWLVVAGGGGGGGSGLGWKGYPMLDGGQGGDGCADTTVTCTGATSGSQLSDSSGTGGAAGQPAPSNLGGKGGTNGYTFAEPGSSGWIGVGGPGGSYDSNFYSGGGGGGGAGYFGGGGGGGAGFNAAGGGGAGGASFAIPGGEGISYGVAPSGVWDGYVTITPVTQPYPTLTISAGTANPTWGNPPVLTATAPAYAEGQLSFYDDVNGGCEDTSSSQASCVELGAAPIENGVAAFTPAANQLSIGDHEIEAYYAGNNNYTSGWSGPVTVSVAKAAPDMTLSILGTQLPAGTQPTSLVVQMPADATGSVGFYDDVNGGCDGSTGPGTACQGLGLAPIVDGYATITTLSPTLGNGTHEIHAAYGGDANYIPDESNPVQVTIGLSAGAPSPALTVAANSRVAGGIVTVHGTANAFTTVWLHERSLGSDAFRTVTAQVANHEGTYMFHVSIARTTEFYVSAVDGSRSSVATARVLKRHRLPPVAGR